MAELDFFQRMHKTFTPGSTRISPWAAALVGIVAIKAVLSLSAQTLSFVLSYSGISYFLLLLLATGASIRRAIRSTRRAQRFWYLVALGCGLWASHQFLVLYYQLHLRVDVPDTSIADELLFFHLVPFAAAVATLPNWGGLDRKSHTWVLNTLLIVGFWAFLYGFVVAPYKFLVPNASKYGARFDLLYLVESLTLILALGVVTLRSSGYWRTIFFHFLGASTLYAISSTAANLASDSGGYVNGRLYGLGLTASVCWFAWVPLSAQKVRASDSTEVPVAGLQDTPVAGWAMLSVAMISIPMVLELFLRDEHPSVRTLRLVVATAAIVLLSGGAYLKEYLDNRELHSEQSRGELALRATEERFRLAARAGRMYAAEWDAATDVVTRSGDLPAVVGLEDADFGQTFQDALRAMHPDDRARVAALLSQRTPESPFVQLRYRLMRRDGSAVWVDRTEQAFFDAHGKLLRTVGMITNITERKQADDALRESEEKFRSIFRDAGVGMIIASLDGRFLAVNPMFCELLGYTEAELLTMGAQSVTVPEDWPAFATKLTQVSQEGRGFRRFEKRCVHKSGRIVYTESSASLIRNSEGVPQYLVGEIVDVTARRESEQALAMFNRRLIQAQEEERARIARELHDDINQQVTLLGIRLAQLQATPGGLPKEMAKQFSAAKEQVAELAASIHHLSHELHSSTLDLVGLRAAMQGWCREFGEKSKVDVSFESDGVPKNLPSDISLHLYRVLQESLNNAAKYSGVERFGVRLWSTSTDIHLNVTDAGKGFDVATAMNGRGLGLKSMRERAQLINADLAIESNPGSGTTIHVRVPVDSGCAPSCNGATQMSDS